MLFILFSAYILIAGDKDRISITKPIHLQSITIGAYNSMGFSNMVTVLVSEISSSNPASISNFSTLSAGVEFTYSTKIDLYSGIKLDRSRQWLPTSFGFVYPFKNFDIGLSYHQKYSNFLDFGEIPRVTIENPTGTGETYKATNETIIHSPSGIFTYFFNKVFTNEDRLSFGIQLYWDFWIEEQSIYTLKGEVNDNNLSWKIGMLYRLSKVLGFGIFYEKGVDINGTYKTDDKLIIDNDSSVIDTPDITTNLKLPDKLSFGLSAKSLDNLCLSITLSTIFWNSIYDYYQDQLDISVSSIYSLSDNFSLSLGFYKTDHNIKDDGGVNQNTTFACVGIRGRLRSFDIRLEILDSHLFTAEYRKQTRVKFGIAF